MKSFDYTKPQNLSHIPIVCFYVKNIRNNNLIRTYDAILDTGADITLVSFSVISQIQPIPTKDEISFKVLGRELQSKPYRLSISLDDSTRGIKVYACPDNILGADILLGRNYLNRYLVEFDGPNKQVRIHD